VVFWYVFVFGGGVFGGALEAAVEVVDDAEAVGRADSLFCIAWTGIWVA
jgi:acyl-CoA thioesterase